MSTLLDNISSPQQRSIEREEKWARLAALLDREHLSAILIRRHENIAWITAGQVDGRISIPAPAGAASLLLTREGRKYYFAANLEAARLAGEEFSRLDYEPIITPWHEPAGLDTFHRIAGAGNIGTDLEQPGLTAVDLAPLRSPLTTGETARLRWLGKQTADVIAQTLLELQPGITEYEMSARTAERLIAQGILPTVLLMATDDRIRKYKHAPSRGAMLEKYGMLNLCGRRWGLAVSITRLVHFGQPPQQLINGFAACAQVNAHMQHASRSGATASDLFATAQRAYSAAGYPGEEQHHHQGGPIAYVEREWLATPHGQQTLAAMQALAWNPSIRGTKVEDTTLLANESIELLTPTPSLPHIDITIEGTTYRSANLLIR